MGGAERDQPLGAVERGDGFGLTLTDGVLSVRVAERIDAGSEQTIDDRNQNEL